jgi:sec-independent protein translocase protein TatB
MFDMSWSELLLIAVVALIVIGPKDLPKAVKVVAQLARKARTLAREFQSGFEEMAREAELHEVKRELESTASGDYARELEQSIDPGGQVARSLELQAEEVAGTATSESQGSSPSAPGEAAAPPAAAPAAAAVTPAEGAVPETAAARAPTEPPEAAAAGAEPPFAKP